jgi:hypothetical protein
MEWFKARIPKATLLQRVLWVESKSVDPDWLFKLPCSPVMYPCPYYALHPDKDAGPETAVNANVNKARVIELIDRKVQLDLIIKEAENELDTYIKPHLVTAMGNAETKDPTHIAAGSVSLYHHVSSKPDWDAIGKALNTNADAVKEKFTVKVKSSDLSVRFTPKRATTAKGKK